MRKKNFKNWRDCDEENSDIEDQNLCETAKKGAVESARLPASPRAKPVAELQIRNVKRRASGKISQKGCHNLFAAALFLCVKNRTIIFLI